MTWQWRTDPTPRVVARTVSGKSHSGRPQSLTCPQAGSVHQVLLEHDEVVGVGRVPPDADDVVADGDGEVDELPLVVHALAPDVLVPVVPRPRLLGFLELPPDAVAAD